MFSCYFVLILYFAGSFGARKDSHIVSHPVELSNTRYSLKPSSQTLASNQSPRTNDYDDHSGFPWLRPPMYVLHASPPTTADDEETVFKTYQPREDPKLYYQSEAYLKEINDQNANKEVTYVYPGWEVVRAGEKYRLPKRLLRSREDYRINKPKICIKCPHDRTLVAKVGADKVILQSPVLTTCSGRKAPRSARLIHLYGPKFGQLLQHGSHTIVGRLMHKNETLRLCKLQVHVIIQTCTTPKYLVSRCLDRNAPCNFTCRDQTLELQGESSLVCGEDMKWEGHLPVCRARNWCQPLSPPDVGNVSCRGGTTDNDLGLNEGTRCRIRCPIGWRWFPKAVAVCRRGVWTNELQCMPKKMIQDNSQLLLHPQSIR
ncbi:uncharacterized protein LOC112052707 [Bicyclus anynana]|uniref:Uncharacterized protein LOC112052707 n=1 Tax=Bicyclus anynana TaxID=110368 RepID=A0A6J1NW73_BICAN|nr:uncharacterized protein LOC112052707 [Bicyclus anynana]